MTFFTGGRVSQAEQTRIAKETRQRRLDQLNAKQAEYAARRAATSTPQSIARELNRPIDEARAQYEKDFAEYYLTMREEVLTEPDPEFYVSDAAPLECDTSVANSIHWDLFLKNTPEFLNIAHNRDTLSTYFTQNGCQRCDQWVYKAAYQRLLSLGLLQTAESLAEAQTVSAPEPVIQRPGTVIDEDEHGHVYDVRTYDFFSPHARPDDRIQGYNPENGLQWVLTKRACDRLSGDEFKKFACISMADRDTSRLRRR